MIAGFLVVIGNLGNRVGRRRLLLIDAAAFGLASLCAAFSTSALTLIAARALLGIAGATLAPSALALIRNMFLDHHQQRTVVISAWFTCFLAGAAIGPLVSGAVLEFVWWGSAFLIGVPVMVLLQITGPLLLPDCDPEAGRLDLASTILGLAAVLTTIYGLTHRPLGGRGSA